MWLLNLHISKRNKSYLSVYFVKMSPFSSFHSVLIRSFETNTNSNTQCSNSLFSVWGKMTIGGGMALLGSDKPLYCRSSNNHFSAEVGGRGTL